MENSLDEIKNKYDFLFGQGNPETDSIADEDTSWLINQCDKLSAEGEALKAELMKHIDAVHIQGAALGILKADTLELVRAIEEIRLTVEFCKTGRCEFMSIAGAERIIETLEVFQAKNEWAKVGK